VEPIDPRNLDFPMPEPGDAEADALNEALQSAAEGIQEELIDVPGNQDFLALLTGSFDLSPAPVQSVACIERLLATDGAETFLPAALADPAAFRRMFALAGYSRWLGAHVARGGWRALFSIDLEAPVTRVLAAQRARDMIAAGVAPTVALRLNHFDLLAGVLYREVLLRRPLEEIALEISELADGALEVALEQAYAGLARKGIKRAADFRLCVIAMGKHGAQELNYSSDIDLMFVFDGAGSGRLDGQGFAVKVVEAMIPLIDAVTEHGHVFRVDTRLRPEGKRGRLARGFESMVQYYYSFGETWERQALIKARACAGDVDLGSELLQRLQGWVYRRTLTIEEINRIKSLKRRIEQRTSDRDEQFTDIKTGFGGIRDIEFATQFLQLLNGGRNESVRQAATLPALSALAQAGILKRNEHEVLADAYRFLRALEHRLQVWDGFQTHSLPADTTELARVALTLDLSTPTVLLARLRAHTLKTRGLMVRLFADLFDQQHAALESELVLDPEFDEAEAVPMLTGYGFSDPQAALRVIRDLARESNEHSMYEARARKYLASMMPALLAFCGAAPDPDQTLRNLERITASLGAKAIFFELMAEDPRALHLFGSIAAHSNWLSDILTRRPGLVDEFIDELQTFASLDRTALRRQLMDRMALAADAADALYWERDVELLRIGLFDLTGRTPLPETLRELAALAEVVLEAALDVAVAETLDREEIDGLTGDPRSGLAVIAMGKLGSGAMNYASDLDLVFAYEPTAFDDAAVAQAFYSRVVRRVLAMLTTSSERGRLYEVDLRLRPRGRAGNLAVTIDELQRYLSTDAGFWERLAGCRARVLNPDTPAGESARRVFDEFVYSAGADAAQTLEMRERLERESPRNALKRGRGGTLDIEFLLAHLQLAHAAAIPALRQPDLWEVLILARDSGLISEPDYDAISGAYAFLRQVVNRLQILDGISRHELPDGDELEVFARRMGYGAGGGLSAADQLTEELDWHRDNARRAMLKYIR
jgi:glutamate-ammonia-ligase adenylyltransferase